MKLFSLLTAFAFLAAHTGWETDFENAKKKAEKDHKLILLNFSGSDWCIPCIKFRKQVLEQESFLQYADTKLVLVNADFPRLKKNALPKEQVKRNEKLADKYNQEGIFPLTVLLDASGKVIKKWEGFPNLTAEQFTDQLKGLANAR